MNTGREAPTPDLFDGPFDGSLSCASELSVVLNTLIDAAQHRGVISSRQDLATRMSRLTGDTITKQMIDAWTASSKKAWRFPFEYAAAIEAACQTHDLQEFLARKRNTHVISGDELLYVEWGRLQHEKEKIAAREMAIKEHLGRSQQ